MTSVELNELGFDRGAHILIKHALCNIEPGEQLEVRGTAPSLVTHVRAWCRNAGHDLISESPVVIAQGQSDQQRWKGACSTGITASPEQEASITWGLAARGAIVEDGAPVMDFPLRHKYKVWSDEAASLYQQALAAQWDPATAIPWDTPMNHPVQIEQALVQVLTYLIENETAALLIPAKFCSQVHPHFREIMQCLAIQTADEARHIEVFTRRAALHGQPMGLSTAGGQSSLKTLIDEPDFALASLLLSVMGEGTFLNLLSFIREHAPDQCTAEIMRLANQDEARHVAFGMGHLKYHLQQDPGLRTTLATAIERRHDALAQTTGLNTEVFDSLALLAAGNWTPEAIGQGVDAVIELTQEMHHGRQRRLKKLGFNMDEAERLSALHTRNFM